MMYVEKRSLGEGVSCTPIIRFSDDEMTTLSEPLAATRRHEYHVVNNDRIIQLRSGRLVMPVAQHRIQETPNRDACRDCARRFLSRYEAPCFCGRFRRRPLASLSYRLPILHSPNEDQAFSWRARLMIARNRRALSTVVHSVEKRNSFVRANS